MEAGFPLAVLASLVKEPDGDRDKQNHDDQGDKGLFGHELPQQRQCEHSAEQPQGQPDHETVEL
jgi:hypothetical protein